MAERARFYGRKVVMSNQFDVDCYRRRARGKRGGGGGGAGGARTCAVDSRTGNDRLKCRCNPSIGGIRQRHLVRRNSTRWMAVMGRAADAAGIHFKLLEPQ